MTQEEIKVIEEVIEDLNIITMDEDLYEEKLMEYSGGLIPNIQDKLIALLWRERKSLIEQ